MQHIDSDPAEAVLEGGPASGPDLALLLDVEIALAQAQEDLRAMGWDRRDASDRGGSTATAPPHTDAPTRAVRWASTSVDRAVSRVAGWSLGAQEWGEARIARVRERRPAPRGRVGRGAGGLALVAVASFVIIQAITLGTSGPDALMDAAPPSAGVTPVPTAPPEPTGSRDPAPSVRSDPDPIVIDVPDAQSPEARPAPPVALRVPAIEVDAPVVIVGLEPDRSMEIPVDVRTVGWYEPFAGAGVVPGEAGTAVIAGHVDSRTQGRGAFWPLRELLPGDDIDVEHADGTVSRWRVESVVRHPKTDIPIEEIFTFEGDERLALITCGGEFDRSVGAYLDNYVVTAVPLRTAVPGSGQALPAAP